MKTPHKHAELIKAWADGAEIEVYEPYAGKYIGLITAPAWNEANLYRIKPEPKPDVVDLALVHRYHRHCAFSWCCGTDEPHNLKLTFDGETGALKAAEVLK